MRLTIGYFAKPSAPDAQPEALLIAESEFSNLDEALKAACSTAERQEAHFFFIDLPDGTGKRYLWDGNDWKRKDA